MQDSNEAVAHAPEGRSIAALAVGALAFLLPFFFIPNAAFPFQFSKTLLALLAVVIILIAFSVRTLRSGTLSFSWSWLSSAILVLPFAYLVSSIFSSVRSLSFFGYELDQDTFGFMALGAALALATTFAVTSKERIFSTLKAIIIGGWIVLLFQAIQILFHVPVQWGVFSSPIQNLIGKWNDLGLFTSLIASLSLLALETMSHSLLRKIALGAGLVVAVALLVLTSFPLAWYLFGIVAFLTLVFSLLKRVARQTGAEAVPSSSTGGIASILAVAAVVFFVFFGSGLSTSLQNHYGISALEVSPSFQGTLSVLGGVYSKSPFFGSGPNTFASQWLLFRPAATLSTVFWSTAFGSGFAYIPTALATGGIVVGLAWLLLIGCFLWIAARALLSPSTGSGASYFLVVSTALGSAFLLAAHLFYNPSSSLTLLLFLFLGLFIASLRGTSLARSVSASFSHNARLAFVSVVGIAVVLVTSLVSLYGAGETYASSVMEGKAAARASANDIPGAISAATSAVSLSAQDRYLRALTNLELSQLSAIAQKGTSDATSQADFQNALSQAIQNSAAAVALDPTSYDNWMTRASVYEAVVPLNITGAADNAAAALESARKLNPASPEIDYQEAALKAYAKDNAGAKAAAEASVAKKADYTPAILLLAQVALNEGNLDDAIASLKSALVFSPNDSSLLYEIGLLELQAKQYQNAADSLAAALAVAPDYANAKFYLGEAAVFLGKNADALALFQDLAKSNPDNTTLTDVITKLQAGSNPFAGSASATLPPETAPAQ